MLHLLVTFKTYGYASNKAKKHIPWRHGWRLKASNFGSTEARDGVHQQIKPLKLTIFDRH
jgi:hypothetical protein